MYAYLLAKFKIELHINFHFSVLLRYQSKTAYLFISKKRYSITENIISGSVDLVMQSIYRFSNCCNDELLLIDDMSIWFSLVFIQNEMRIDNQSIFELEVIF
jgi:hypothetical protein